MQFSVALTAILSAIAVPCVLASEAGFPSLAYHTEVANTLDSVRLGTTTHEQTAVGERVRSPA